MDYSSDGGRLSEDTPSLLLVRLSPFWTEHAEPIETGYERTGYGWYPDVTTVELVDSMRAWWRMSLRSARERDVRYAVAVVDGVTRLVMQVESWIGPREDGRVAFQGTPIKSGPIFDLLVGPNGRAVPSPPGAANPIRYWPPSQPGVPNTAVPHDPFSTLPTQVVRDQSVKPTVHPNTLPPPVLFPTATALPPPLPPSREGGRPRSIAKPSARLGVLKTLRLGSSLYDDMQRIAGIYAEHSAALRRAGFVRSAFAQIDWQKLPECQIALVRGSFLIEPRKGASRRTWSSSSSGRSYSGYRIGGLSLGSSSGSVSKGESISLPPPDVLQATDSGQFVVTADRVSFIGTMFTRTITPDRVAGYDASGRRILFAPKNSTKIWAVQFATHEDFVLATSAVLLWDELYTRTAQSPGLKRSSAGPLTANWLLSELVGEHPGEIWALRRAANAIEQISTELERQRPRIIRGLTHKLNGLARPPGIINGVSEPCWSCGVPVVLSEDATCACGSDMGTAPKGHVPYLSDIANSFLLKL